MICVLLVLHIWPDEVGSLFLCQIYKFRSEGRSSCRMIAQEVWSLSLFLFFSPRLRSGVCTEGGVMGSENIENMIAVEGGYISNCD